jgi:alkylation response protein AidB-like acyl-CoA dehydrogenase
MSQVTMTASWSQDQRDLADAILDFATKHLRSDVRLLDKAGRFDLESWRKCGEFGIHGLPIPERFGGLGKDPLTTIRALEVLGYACRDNGLLFSINAHMWTCELPLLDFGTDEQRERHLPRLCRGELIGGNAMSEPAAGSDAYSLRTTATRKEGRYVLNGSKLWVTNGPVADMIVVFANADLTKGKFGISAFLVEKGAPGLTIAGDVEKMGMRTSPMAKLFLDDCEVPEANRLGREGAGIALFNHAMTWERGFILATAVGAMQRQLETCLTYAKDRKQFGKSIGRFQPVADRLINMATRVETCRAMLYNVGHVRTLGKSGVLEAAMAKLHISESWVQSCQDAIQIHGANGYDMDYGIERDLRDAIGSRIFSGTNEIQRVLIGSLLDN